MTRLSEYFNAIPPMKVDLIEWFGLHEASGNRIGEHAGKVLVDTNTVTGTTGPGSNNASSFARANSEWLDGTSVRGLEGRNSDFSISCWFNATTLGSDYYSIVGQVTGSLDEQWAWNLSFDHTNSKPRFVMGNGSTWKVALGPNTLSTATWYHAYCQFNSVTQDLSMSINNATLVDTALAGVPMARNNGLSIGHQLGDTRYWDGGIAEFVMYKRLLTTDQQSWMYNSGNGRTYSDIT